MLLPCKTRRPWLDIKTELTFYLWLKKQWYVYFRPSAKPTSPDKVFTPANQCHICDKTFANPYNVKLHIKVDHEHR